MERIKMTDIWIETYNGADIYHSDEEGYFWTFNDIDSTFFTSMVETIADFDLYIESLESDFNS